MLVLRTKGKSEHAYHSKCHTLHLIQPIAFAVCTGLSYLQSRGFAPNKKACELA
jgi:hypothetical protein